VYSFAPFREYIDALVHPGSRADRLVAFRHRAFIGSRLTVSLVALAGLPLYLAMRGAPSGFELAILLLLVAPIVPVCMLSLTGAYEAAYIVSSATIIALVTLIALQTGGIGSFAAIWLVVVPFEAALSASRRVILAVALLSLAALSLLVASNIVGFGFAMTQTEYMAFGALGMISSALYATGLVLSAGSVMRASSPHDADDGWTLLVRNASGPLTRHGRNGAVLSTSPAIETLFGCSSRDLLGHSLFERVHVADRPAYLKAIGDASACDVGSTTESVVEFRARVSADDTAAGGRFTWIEMRCRRFLRQSSGADVAQNDVVAIWRDIGARSEQEAAADTVGKEERDAAKNQFLAVMSHELRTPLNAIIGFSEMLSKEEKFSLGQDKRVEYSRLINEAGQHLLGVVNGVLDMSKLESGTFEITPEPVSAFQVVKGCCDLLMLRARDAGVELILDMAQDAPAIFADRRALHQIVINLIANAVRFTNPGGSVTIRMETNARDVVLSVEDTGIGIAGADLPRLCEPFFQARGSYDRRHDGTGLGLSIVKGLVNLHGGQIDIQSEIGKGTRIAVRLPAEHNGAEVVFDMRAHKQETNGTTDDASPDRVKKIA
jgi:cell cycle sensor histidine kinase DivJ